MKTGHVGLNVTNLEKSLSFYTNIFELETIRECYEEGKKFAFLGHNGNVTLTLWEQSQTEFSKSHSGLHHLAFEADSIEIVQSMEQKLVNMGVKMIYQGIVAHEEGSNSGGIFFIDPDGIRLEIYAPLVMGTHDHSHTDGPACGFF
ncbi:VOC family protein [Xylanibacillus composti]|uniref:Lactoylglutathione lyase n=1 Tax=Xylanibacillus composti TaxID=1572762 RepID=A0A8J4H196_9BACL|nr:VOC family protein [Xylanibacillus composti]MDT9724836.1 VOC family protein [Xylanibacillus composti]GIQ69073.1 lactoylglutathione lyase [Xylanibacillus composti]